MVKMNTFETKEGIIQNLKSSININTDDGDSKLFEVLFQGDVLNKDAIIIKPMEEDPLNKFNETKVVDSNQDGITTGDEIYSVSTLYNPYYIEGDADKRDIKVFNYDFKMKF